MNPENPNPENPKEVFIVYKNCGKWEIDEIFEEESDAIRYVDEYKEEFELIDNFIKYEKSLVTEEELINLQREVEL